MVMRWVTSLVRAAMSGRGTYIRFTRRLHRESEREDEGVLDSVIERERVSGGQRKRDGQREAALGIL